MQWLGMVWDSRLQVFHQPAEGKRENVMSLVLSDFVEVHMGELTGFCQLCDECGPLGSTET